MLLGWMFEIESLFTIGLLGCLACIGFGSASVLIFSVVNFNEDISKRQGYLLFSTPRSTKQIIGAKLLMTFFTFAGLSILFAILLSVDLVYAAHRYGASILEFLRDIFFDESLTGEALYKTLLTPKNILGLFMFLCNYIFSFLLSVVLAYIAIVLTKTLLGNSKGRIILAFVFWCIASFVLNYISTAISSIFTAENLTTSYTLLDSVVTVTGSILAPTNALPSLLIDLAACIGGFFLVDWLVDKKLSL